MTVTLQSERPTRQSGKDGKQNITLRLSKETIRKARILAAKQSTSISGFLTREIETAVDRDQEYERDMDRAFAIMRKGFHLGGVHKLDRDALHER